MPQRGADHLVAIPVSGNLFLHQAGIDPWSMALEVDTATGSGHGLQQGIALDLEAGSFENLQGAVVKTADLFGIEGA